MAACSSESSSSGSAAGGGAGHGGETGMSGSGTGTAGTGAAGTRTGGGGAGGASSDSRGGAAGTPSGGMVDGGGDDGLSSADTTGAPTAMRDGGIPDRSTEGAGDGGSDSGDLRAAASALDGFAILKPCPSSFRPSGNSNDGTTCDETPETENQHITKQFGGDPNVTYNVKVRIAGVSERYWYSGGTLDPMSNLFYSGGLPTIHGPAPNNNLAPGQGACKIHPPETDSQFRLPFAVPTEIRPSDGCYNGFNVFAMTVSSPKQSYYLNFTTDFDGVDRQPHKTYLTDYTVTIPISGNAQLDFYTIDGDHHQVADNGAFRVPNVKTPQPYTGNFLELTVVDVTRRN